MELAKKTANLNNPLIFCGVKFMGESAKILNPNIDVYMPRLANCSMARMAKEVKVENNIKQLKQNNIDFIPITYINSTAKTKAIVAQNGGLTCTSSNAQKIIEWALSQNKKIFFLPDKNLGRNIATKLGISAKDIGEDNVATRRAKVWFANVFETGQIDKWHLPEVALADEKGEAMTKKLEEEFKSRGLKEEEFAPQPFDGIKDFQKFIKKLEKEL